jgi:hypothetical protein
MPPNLSGATHHSGILESQPISAAAVLLRAAAVATMISQQGQQLGN